MSHVFLLVEEHDPILRALNDRVSREAEIDWHASQKSSVAGKT